MGQSMLYHTLYTSVYNLQNVEHAVDKMLYDKEYARTRKESLCSQDGTLAAMIGKMADSPEHESSSGSAGLYATSDEEPCDVMDILDRNMVPFPYKTAKALDGTHYRNLPQDVWTELVKERRREQQRPDCNGFLAGIKCLVELGPVLGAAELSQLESEARPEHRHLSETGSNLYVAHIQEMAPNQGPVCCYVEPLGKKLTVPYDSLRPLCSTPVAVPGVAVAGGSARQNSRTSERSSCGERHLSHTDSSCSTPQMGSPTAAQPYGMHLVGSPIFSQQVMPPAPVFAVAESPDPGGFYSPGSAEESGYRSRNASHSSNNSGDGSVGDVNSPHVRNGAPRRWPYYLAPPAGPPPPSAGYFYLPPQYPYPGSGQ
ncbi:uncharacterized protein LOC119108250 [Pollicipes pollicipes]|uniref:uncharacterized protein LOC119108250 n=1 Tax=Pollicipes pollicipes TaxID=41117 RepID=UPI001884B04A|nr:uncharacterized protein LOC119108250 [Pollicipes pollicipes]